jgi:hypothetical protein
MYLRVPYLSIVKDLLTKYTGCCLTSMVAYGRSTAMTMLTIASVVATYNSNTSSGFGGTSVGRDLRYYLCSIKATVA